MYFTLKMYLINFQPEKVSMKTEEPVQPFVFLGTFPVCSHILTS